MEDGTLRITNISKSDGGRYTCVARNRFGTSSSTGTLVVKGILVHFFFLVYPLSQGFKLLLEGKK